jgi:hypothetical protein
MRPLNPMIWRSLLALACLPSALALAKEAKPAEAPPIQCAPLPSLRTPNAFNTGEVLEFALDALGAQAGKMVMRVLPAQDGVIPVEVKAQTNTFFSKVRRVTGTGTSYLNPKTLRPARYVEDALENEVRKTADVTFRAKDRNVHVAFTIADGKGQRQFQYANDGLDVAGAIYLMRQIPMKAGLPVCFDVYGIRSLWRMVGRVEGREHVSLPVGEFEAWHLVGVATRLDASALKREVHVWISDDPRRLPLAALGAIDLGAIRATLTSFSQPGTKRVKADGKESLKW